MCRNRLEQKLKAASAFLIILVLLPYIFTVFVKGIDRKTEEKHIYVKVKDGEEKAKEREWTEYLTGILADEVPENYETELLMAQAVLIRTQLYRELEQSEDKILGEKSLTADEMTKRWGEERFPALYERFHEAVEETEGTVLFYQDDYAWTPFHLQSTGKTRSAAEVLGTEEYPYVEARDCPADREADGHIQVFSYTYREVQDLCRDFLVAAESTEQAQAGYTFSDFEICERDSAGYVSKLRIGDTYCTGDQFRDALSLPSGAFELSDSGGEASRQEEEEAGNSRTDPADEAGDPGESRLIIVTSGKGHGLGMSLWTANTMAAEGSTWREILEYFFEGTQICTEELPAVS